MLICVRFPFRRDETFYTINSVTKYDKRCSFIFCIPKDQTEIPEQSVRERAEARWFWFLTRRAAAAAAVALQHAARRQTCWNRIRAKECAVLLARNFWYWERESPHTTTTNPNIHKYNMTVNIHKPTWTFSRGPQGDVVALWLYGMSSLSFYLVV